MINFDDIKPGNLLYFNGLLINIDKIFGKKKIISINFRAGYKSVSSRYRHIWENGTSINEKDLNLARKARINEIFNWYILKFENEMYNQEQNP